MDKKISALILCAGQSRRMGAFKPLLPFGEKTVIETVVSLALSVCQRAVVVTGKNAEKIEEALSSYSDRIDFVRNTDYASTDMLTSVKRGLQMLSSCESFFLLPGDMPLIRSETFEELLIYREEADVIFPSYQGLRGHPVLLSASLIPALLSYEGDDGVRGFLKTVKREREIMTDDRGILFDLDTKEDYARALGQMKK